LEDGKDLRITERPLIGIYPENYDSLTDQRKEELNVPVKSGVLVADLLPEYGAAQAGIEAGDVIVGINGRKVDRIRELSTVMAELKAGDEINVEAYRGPEKMDFVIHTKTQKFQSLPDTPEELAKEIENQSSKALEALEQALVGITDAEASWTPGEDEWSIKDILVHLIHNERDTHTWINDLVSGQERAYDEWPGDNLFRIRATLVAYPRLDDLLAEFRRSLKETVASVAFIDPEFTRRKASYWRLGTQLLGGDKHIIEHITQIENNLEAVREKNSK
jgi:membrane-associated protease RseP (regulator of RpoE activity)